MTEEVRDEIIPFTIALICAFVSYDLFNEPVAWVLSLSVYCLIKSTLQMRKSLKR